MVLIRLNYERILLMRLLTLLLRINYLVSKTGNSCGTNLFIKIVGFRRETNRKLKYIILT